MPLSQTVAEDSTGAILDKDIINTSLVYTNKSVTTSATLLNVSGTNLAVRKMIIVQPTNGTIYLGSNASVTSTTGTPVFTNQSISLSLGENINLYAIATTTVNVVIMEGS